MTTNEAFENLTSKRGWYKQAGIGQQLATSLKSCHKKGLVTNDRMVALLAAAGYKQKQEIIWEGGGGRGK